MRPALPLLAAAACLADAGTWLGGSTQRGGKATFAIEGGELVGTAVAGTPNSFLCTDRTYGDFTLEFEFKADPRLNSGVQIRSAARDAATRFTDAAGKEQVIPAGRVHGYQVEIDTDPSDRGGRQWTAGLYEEGRRGWLFPGALGGDKAAFGEQGRRLTKVGDWNRVKVEAVGPRIRTWLNGEPRVDAMDGDAREGFVGFQVHALRDASLAGARIRWRDVRLTEVAPNTLTEAERAEGWELLFDGATTAGWRARGGDAFPAGGWKVADGALSVLGEGGGDIVATRAPTGAFALSVEFRLSQGANSGIFYLVQDGPDEPTRGLEFQLLDDLRHEDARRGKDGNRTVAALYDLVPPRPGKLPARIGQWNHALVRTSPDGRKVEHWLNGRLALTYDRLSEDFRRRRAASKFADPKYGTGFGEWPAGTFMLQDHGDRVDFRNVKLRDMRERQGAR